MVAIGILVIFWGNPDWGKKQENSVSHDYAHMYTLEKKKTNHHGGE